MNSLENDISRNPFSGRNSAGPRFQFRIRAIARKNLYLPLCMKYLPEIKRLLSGDSPLDVFSCDSITDARSKFNRLRKKHDFPFWAALEYKIPDKNEPNRFIPLFLNPIQHKVADVFLRRAFEGRRGLYLISKSIPNCGLTTIVQAFIIWMQTHIWNANSFTFTHSLNDVDRIKAKLCRSLGIKTPLDSLDFPVTKTDAHAYCNTYLSPSIPSGIDCGFFHLADMSKWNDRNAKCSSLIFSSTLSKFQRNPAALFVMEGDRPTSSDLRSVLNWNYRITEPIRYLKLVPFGVNPFFIDKWLFVSDKDIQAIIYHIDLDEI